MQLFHFGFSGYTGIVTPCLQGHLEGQLCECEFNNTLFMVIFCVINDGLEVLVCLSGQGGLVGLGLGCTLVDRQGVEVLAGASSTGGICSVGCVFGVEEFSCGEVLTGRSYSVLWSEETVLSV